MEKKLTSPILIIQGGAHDADLRYLSGFTAPDPVVLLVDGSHKYLVVSLLEFGRAKETAAVTEVWTPDLLKLKGAARVRLAAWAEAALRRIKKRSVTVPRDFPVGVADDLRAANFKVTVADSALVPQRRIKSDREIQHITQAQRAAVKSMRAAVKQIADAEVDAGGFLREGKKRLTSESVRRTIDVTLLAHDCVAMDTIVAGGAQGADPHERGRGPLRAGQLIVIDIFPRHKANGYWGDITRTVVKGKPTPEAQRMFTAVRAAQTAALKSVRPGISVKRVHQTAQRTLQDHGFETTVKNGWGEGFIHSTGHGIGLDIHEAPSLNLSATRLRTGDVVTIEPGLYYKRWGGVRIEDTVAVTPNGAKILAACPYVFNV